jgi:transcriptional regulator with XRE-family HTH domain
MSKHPKGIAMPRRSKNVAATLIETSIENHVASRIRLRRGLLGMSQSDLAKALGITFQQVQKYERGSNRVSVGKLYRLSDILDVPLVFFFDGLETDAAKAAVDSARGGEGGAPVLSRRELDLLRAWKLAPSHVADAVSSLLRAIIPGSEGDEAEEAAITTPPPPIETLGGLVDTPSSDVSLAAPPVVTAPRRRGPVPGSKRVKAADKADKVEAKTAAPSQRRRRSAIWDPSDIKDWKD